MRPWDIIGWAIIFVVCGTGALGGLLVVASVAYRNILHLRSRQAARHPTVGQTWVSGNDKTRFTIQYVVRPANGDGIGHIEVATLNAKFTLTYGEWLQRWRRQLMRLES